MTLWVIMKRLSRLKQMVGSWRAAGYSGVICQELQIDYTYESIDS